MKFKKIKFSLLLTLVSAFSFGADPSVSVFIDNPTYTSARIFEFNIKMQATGSTSAFELRTFQTGLYLNPAWFNGGTLTAQNVSTFSEMGGVGYNGAFQWNSTDNLLNCSVNFDVVGPSNCISATVASIPIVITRIRLINTVDFTCAFTPDIKFNYVSNVDPLRLRTTFTWREIACTVNYDMFYPGRTYTGNASFNGETYSSGDADGKSPINASMNPSCCFDQLTITAFMEGFYYGGGQMNAALLSGEIWHAQADQADTVIVELRSAANKSLINSTKTILGTDGIVYCLYPDNLNLIGNSYWIVFKHRNTIETWSSNTVPLVDRTSYDFSSAQSQAFGGNMIDIGNLYGENSRWAFYSGDIADVGYGLGGINGLQDGIVESQDYSEMENAAYVTLVGYVIQDISGDGVVESADYSIMENNAYFTIYTQTP